jgi:hypothetical protein
MGNNVTNPQFSFLKFGEPDSLDVCCDGDSIPALQVALPNDLFFQFSITSETIMESYLLELVSLANFQLVLLKGTGNATPWEGGNVLRNLAVEDVLLFERYRTGDMELTFVWKNNLNLFADLLECDECFQLGIYINAAEEIYKVSNPLVRICDTCYTSVLEFNNKKDYGGVRYCNVPDFVNRVRLPIYLTQANYVEVDKSVYRKSNGVIKQNSNVLYKEYTAVTEFLPELLHDKINLALSHNMMLNIYDEKYEGGISKNGEYGVEWDKDLELCLAPANFKAIAYGFTFKNGNCTDCNVYVSCVPVAIPSFDLIDAYKDVAYSQTLTLTGKQPFVLSAITKPSWMTVTVSGAVVTFSGTPTALATGLEVSFTVTNDCGTANFDKTVNVLCVPVAITGTPVLPDAVSTLAYSYSFPITGSTPYSLTSITKPAWMTIAVVGANIQFSGTPAPGDAGTGVAVSFDIENDCGSESFSDTVDVFTDPATAILAFAQYQSGSFIFTLSDRIYTTGFVISQAFVDGATTSDCTGGTTETDQLTSDTFPPATLTASLPGDVPMSCSVNSYERRSSFYVNGTEKFDGDTITIGGTLVTINISPACNTSYTC